MGRKYDFNYIVIGSGPAGSAAALTLARAKKRVALVEGKYFGGANLNTRDIPYGVALDFAHTYYKVSRLPEFSHQDLTFNFPTIVAQQFKAIIESGGGNKKPYEDAGVICINGYANFLDNNTIAIGEHKFTAEHFIIATGAHLNTSTIAGTTAVNYLPPDTALKIRRLPKAVLVVGGGSTGCEIAEYYAKLGAKTLIMERSARLLPREDADASQALTDHFTNDLGIMVLTSCKVIALEQDDLSKRVIFQNSRTEKMVRVDCIVLATGSQPNIDLGLENTDIKFTKTGSIKIDKYFTTSAKNIYAVGDVVSDESSTERAKYEGKLLATNIVNKTKSSINYKGFARTTNTCPAIVTIGLTEDDLKRQKRKYKKSVIYLKDLPSGKINSTYYGFVKLIADRNNHIIGGCIIAPYAQAMAGELALTVRHNLTALELASTPHIANDFNYAIQLAAKKLIAKKK